MATKSKELSIEDKLWQTADALRGSMDASEYRNVVLGLIFLKYVSDSFETRYAELVQTDYPEDAEDPDMYLRGEYLLGTKRSAVVFDSAISKDPANR